ncbi:MAG: hypothetical protein M1825_006095 [Sarcosagium campestre]|nr:MAG: hypothetical protein M1825_006095 [Sarcosagium campestre]
MKILEPTQFFLAISLASVVSSNQLLPSFLTQRNSKSNSGAQKPIMNIPNIALPPSRQDNPSVADSGSIIISDVIAKDRAINIFAGFTRDIQSIAERLADKSQNTTVLAPLNSAVTSLPQKPWEDQRDYAVLGEAAYDGSDGEDRAHRNLRSFVEAHVIALSPWKEGEKVETLGGGRKIWWENEDGKKMLRPDNIEVSSIADRVSNGEVWILKEVLPPT